jgi:hypothetical protein
VRAKLTSSSLRSLTVAFASALLGVGLVAASACTGQVKLGDLLSDAEATVPADGAGPAGDATDDGVSPPPAGSGAPDTGVDASAAAIASIPSLVLWLDGDRGVSHPAGSLLWADQSGFGNDATPPRAVPGVTDQGFNGHHAIAFDSTQLLTVRDVPSMRFTGDFAVVIVARSETPASDYGCLYGKSAVAYPFPGPGMFVNYPPLSTAPSSTVGAQVDFTNFIESSEQGVSDGVARIFAMQRRGTFLSIRVNGDTPTSTTVPPTDETAPGVDVFMGGHLTGSVVQGLTGAIAEVLVVNGTLAASDEEAIHVYLSDKYAIH